MLVNRRLRLAGGEVVTKYAFPFWDEGWSIKFFLVDRLGQGPAILRPPVRQGEDGAITSTTRMSDLGELDSIGTEEFRGLFHYDPWWVFRGMSGVSDEMKQAIFPTNIARPFRWKGKHWKVHDVVVGDAGARVVAIVAKDDLFERRDFTREDLDLGTTWPKVPAPRR